MFLRKFSVSKSFMDENGGITFSRRKVLVSQCRKIEWAPLQCFRKFGVSNNFMHNRGITFFRWKFFVSQCRKISRASVQCFRKLGVSKNLCLIGGITFFPQKFFVSQCRKNSWASLQCLRKMGVSKLFMHTRRYHVSPSKVFGLTVPKIYVCFPSMCQKIWGIEKFYA